MPLVVPENATIILEMVYYGCYRKIFRRWIDLRYGDSNTAKEGLTLAEEKTEATTNRRKKNTTKIDGNDGNLKVKVQGVAKICSRIGDHLHECY